jgi:peptide/nickel transport system permease protein
VGRLGESPKAVTAGSARAEPRVVDHRRSGKDLMTAPLDVSGAATEARPEAGLAGLGMRAIEGRSLGQIAWLRLRRDKVAIAGGIIVLLLILMAIGAPLLVKLFGHPPNEFHQDLIDPTLQIPKGRWGGISRDFPLGVEPQNGRDLF